MNLLLSALLKNNLLFDAFGIIGLGLLGLAAIKLARTYKSWGGTMMAFGTIGLLIARLYFILVPIFMTTDLEIAMGPVGISLCIAVPPLLLSFGLAGVVWGLWGHERWLQEETH